MARIFRFGGCAGALVGLPLVLSAAGGCGGPTQVRQVFMALDGNGTRPRDTFYPDSTQIYCDVVWSGADPDSTVVAEFLQTSGEQNLFDGSDTNVPVAHEWAAIEQVGPSGITTMSFSIQPPQPVNGGDPLPFPRGDWKCLISVNGVSAGEASFKVVYPTPDCPPSGVATAGNTCLAYKDSAQCPSADNYTDSSACTCTTALTGERLWSCK